MNTPNSILIPVHLVHDVNIMGVQKACFQQCSDGCNKLIGGDFKIRRQRSHPRNDGHGNITRDVERETNARNGILAAGEFRSGLDRTGELLNCDADLYMYYCSQRYWLALDSTTTAGHTHTLDWVTLAATTTSSSGPGCSGQSCTPCVGI